MFLLTVLVLGAKNLQKSPNRYRHLRLSFATYNSDWSKVSDVSEPLRNTWLLVEIAYIYEACDVMSFFATKSM